MNTIRLVTFIFDTKISPTDIPYLRGNMIRISGDDPLFHNHYSNGLKYNYPLVQYKRIDKHAAMVGINQGAEALKRMLCYEKSYKFLFGNQTLDMKVKNIISKVFSLSCNEDDTECTYIINQWLPLNGQNYRMYQQTEGLIERLTMLEHILIGNILSFAKGVNVFFEYPVRCRLLKLEPIGLTKYKDVELMNFTAEFKCNVNLPDYIGLGKSVSMGNGIVKLKL